MLEAERGSIWGGESRSGELGSSLSRLRGEKVGNCVLGDPMELSINCMIQSSHDHSHPILKLLNQLVQTTYLICY